MYYKVKNLANSRILKVDAKFIETQMQKTISSVEMTLGTFHLQEKCEVE